MAGRPRRACIPCNSQKLRCTGGRPFCERCRRLERACSWSPTAHSRAGRCPTPAASPAAPPAAVYYVGIPSDLVFQLVDTFCTSLYSSPLLVHKATLVADLHARRVKPHLVLSICALASSFCQSADSSTPPFRANGFSREWAEHAARLLFGEAEKPEEDKVVSFTILCLFWYGHGDWQRAAVHEGNALIHLRLTGLGEEPHPVSADSSNEACHALNDELRCRRFWAAYVINQFVSDPTASFSWATIANVRLPCPEDLFEHGMTTTTPLRRSTIRDDVRTESLFSEVVRITAFWSAVYKTIRDRTEEPIARLSTLNLLDAKLRRWRADLPGCFSLAVTAATGPDTRLRSSLLILHVIYHQCICSLHASVVPLFSLGPAQPFLAYIYSQRLSSQIAYDNACAISQIVQTALAVFPEDAFRWSGFVGYALYCSCAIQLPFLWSVSPDVAASARGNIKANLETMAKIGRNWRYVLNLAVHVRRLYRYHSTDPVVLPHRIQDFSVSDLSGKGRSGRNVRSVLGQHENVWDYERTLDRRQPMNPNQNQQESLLEECKELVDQVPLSDVSLSTALQAAENTQPLLLSTPRPTEHLNRMSSPPSLFGDMNIYAIDEQEQLLFMQAMDSTQAQDGTNDRDAFSDWLGSL